MVFSSQGVRRVLTAMACALLTTALLLPSLSQAASKTRAKSSKREAMVRNAVAKNAGASKRVAALQKKRLSTKSQVKKTGRASKHARANVPRRAGGMVRGRDGRFYSTRSAKAVQSVSYTARARARAIVRTVARPEVSTAERMGLHSAPDGLEFDSSVALVIDQDTNKVLLSKNESAVLPIASLTKLMTGLVLAEAQLPMDESITITYDDVDTVKKSHSRLAVGTTLSRGELMHLALMSSENRAAHALGRTYPGGLHHFVSSMNAKARELGMRDTHYVDPTGLQSRNRSSAKDLAILVASAYQRTILRDLSTSPSHQLDLGSRVLEYKNSNRLIQDPAWQIGLQKTGYISEAGRCLVMQANVGGRKLIMVFLDATGRASRAHDAERVRQWVMQQPVPQPAQQPVPQLAARPQG